jgi:hypothetical protein
MRIRGLVSAMTEFFFFQRYDTRGLVNAVRITEHTECSTTKQLVSARKIYSMQYHSTKNIEYTESVTSQSSIHKHCLRPPPSPQTPTYSLRSIFSSFACFSFTNSQFVLRSITNCFIFFFKQKPFQCCVSVWHRGLHRQQNCTLSDDRVRCR